MLQVDESRQMAGKRVALPENGQADFLSTAISVKFTGIFLVKIAVFFHRLAAVSPKISLFNSGSSDSSAFKVSSWLRCSSSLSSWSSSQL